ncbi:MAG: hypothetical protein Q3998_05295, partial [Porphyromonas sp.]|nr:hypothetical protein [Porphyromonas sp.]
MPNIKIINISRDIKVGVNTVVEFLQKKGVVEDYGPNTRVSAEEGIACVKELGKSLSQEEKDDLIRKYTTSKANKSDASGVSKENARGEHKSTPAESPKKKEEVIKASVPEDLRPKIVSKGSIDLSGSHPSKEEPKSEENKKVVSEAPEAKEDKKLEPAVVEKKKETPEPVSTSSVEKKEPSKPVMKEADIKPKMAVEKPKSEEIQISVDKKTTPETPVKEKKEDTKQVVKPTPVPEKKIQVVEEKKEESLFSPAEPQASGIKILGKIDLSTIEGYSSAGQRNKKKKGKEGGDTDASSEKKKRKRIGKQKVDITSPENQTKETRGGQKKGSPNPNNQNQKGRGD